MSLVKDRADKEIGDTSQTNGNSISSSPSGDSELLSKVVEAGVKEGVKGVINLTRFIGSALNTTAAVVTETINSIKEENFAEIKAQKLSSDITNTTPEAIQILENKPILEGENNSEEQYYFKSRKKTETLDEFINTARDFLTEVRSLTRESTIDLVFEKNLIFLLEQELARIESNIVQADADEGGSNGGNYKGGRIGASFPDDDKNLIKRTIEKLEESLQSSHQTQQNSDFLENLSRYLSVSSEEKKEKIINLDRLREPWWIEILNSIERFSTMSVLLLESLDRELSLSHTLTSSTSEAEEITSRTIAEWKSFWQDFSKRFFKFIGKAIAIELKPDIESHLSQVSPSTTIQQNFNAPVGSVSVGENNNVVTTQNSIPNSVPDDSFINISIEDIAIMKPLYEKSKLLTIEKHIEVREYLGDLVEEINSHKKPRRIKAIILALREICKKEAETMNEIKELANILKITIPE